MKLRPYGELVASRDAIVLRWRKPKLDTSLEQLRGFLRVGEVANRETRFDGGVFRDPDNDHLLLAYEAGRVVAMAVLEPERRVAEARWMPQRFAHVDDINGTAPWVVCFVWSLRQRRQQGLATWMLKSFAQYLSCEVSDFGWEVPFSPAGEQLARKLSPERLLAGR